MYRERDEFQQAFDVLIDLEVACREAELPSRWLTSRSYRAHVLIRDKRNYRELRAILIELADALLAKEKRKKN